MQKTIWSSNTSKSFTTYGMQKEGALAKKTSTTPLKKRWAISGKCGLSRTHIIKKTACWAGEREEWFELQSSHRWSSRRIVHPSIHADMRTCVLCGCRVVIQSIQQGPKADVSRVYFWKEKAELPRSISLPQGLRDIGTLLLSIAP